MEIKNKILEAVNGGISNALDFNLDDYNSDSNDLYISKKHTNLDVEEKLLELKYSMTVIIDKLSNGVKITLEECDVILSALSLDYQYTLENDKSKLGKIIRNFYKQCEDNISLNWIDTLNITDMSYLFQGLKFFNGDISKWDTSNVTNMEAMFKYATSFNLPLNTWNVSNVTNMKDMFDGAEKFNQDISNWDVSNVINMEGMFYDARIFNLPIGKWDVSNVKYMTSMFAHTWFNQDLRKWKVTNVCDSRNIFYDSFMQEKNKPLDFKELSESQRKADFKLLLQFNLNDYDNGNDNVYISKKKVNLDSEEHIEKLKYDFEKIINKIIVSETISDKEQKELLEAVSVGVSYRVESKNSLKALIQHCCYMFGWDADLNWIDTRDVTDISDLFSYTKFNGDISKWDTSNVTNMSNLFKHAINFNGNISKWDVSNVVLMDSMFCGAINFNLQIGDWNTSKVMNMSRMFCGARAFNLPIGRWNISNVTDMTGMFSNACSFNLPIGGWDTSNVTNMTDLFFYATSFNLPIGDWDVRNVNYAPLIFSNARNFDLDISDWTMKDLWYAICCYNHCPIRNSYKALCLK